MGAASTTIPIEPTTVPVEADQLYKNEQSLIQSKYIVYLYGLSENINKNDIFMALGVWSVKDIALKKIGDKIIGLVSFKHQSDFITAINQRVFQIKDQNIIVILYDAKDNSTDSTRQNECNDKNIQILSIDENKNKNGAIEAVPDLINTISIPDTNLDKNIEQNVEKEFIQPIKHFVKKSSVPEILKFEPELSNKIIQSSKLKDDQFLSNLPTIQRGETVTPKNYSPKIDQQIPSNPPFILYFFNILPNFSKNMIIDMILNNLELRELNGIKVEQLTNCYSVEFTNRTDLILTIEKNNFFIEGQQLEISLIPKTIRVSNRSKATMAAASNKKLTTTSMENDNCNGGNVAISLNRELEKLFNGQLNKNKSDAIVVDNRSSASIATNKNLPCQQKKSSRSRRNRGKNAQTSNEQNQNPWHNLKTPKLLYNCIRCKKSSNLTCSNCGMFYCSNECQIKDWHLHKNNCRIPKLITSVEFYEQLKNELNVEKKDLINCDDKTDRELKTNHLDTVNVPMVNINNTNNENNDKQLNSKNMQNLLNSINKEENTMTNEQVQQEHVKKTPNPIKRTTPMISDIPKPDTNVYITYVLDGITVFVRSANVDDDHEYFNNLSKIGEYAKHQSLPLFEYPMIGQIILAPLKRNLQRALVLKQKGIIIAVTFIDFGNIEMVKFDECHELNYDLQMLKRFVHKCTIELDSENRTNHKSQGILESYKGIKLKLMYEIPFNNLTLIDLLNPINGISFKNLISELNAQKQ